MVIYPVKKTKPTLIGAKALGLWHISKVGLSVPDFLVLPATTFTALPKSFKLSNKDQSFIHSILTGWGFPHTKVVVRSSVADEDGVQHAFAGIMDSFLNVSNFEDLYDSIIKCALSAFSERAFAYRRQKGLSSNVQVAVIIQKQVEATQSGIMFTTFPEYPQEVAIHVVDGLGNELTQGNIQPSEYYLLKGEANSHYSLLLNGQLNEEQLLKLSGAAAKLEDYFKRPQDVEFVFDNNELFIVQSRPITQSIPEVLVYDNSNIQESYCGVTTPLTFSFAQRAYTTVYTQTMQVLALPQNLVVKNASVVNNLLGLVEGRIYYNINNWYRGLLLLPSFRQNKADMEKMMGLEEPVDFIEDKKTSLVRKIITAPRLLINLISLLKGFKGLDKKVPAFIKKIEAHYQKFYGQDLSGLSLKDLLVQKDQLDKQLLFDWTTPIINDFFVMMSNGQVVRSLKKAGAKDPDGLLRTYLNTHLQNLPSAQPAKFLQSLAKEASSDSLLKELITDLPPDIHQQIEKKFPRFFQKVTDYIARYGDRTIGELKLETITMRLEPSIFYQYLRNLLDLDIMAFDQPSTIFQFNEQIPDPGKKRIEKKLGTLRTAVFQREALRLYRTYLFGMYRSIYLEVGKRFTESNSLSTPRDIFYLAEQEILNYTTAAKDYKSLIEQRKKEFQGYEKAEAYSRVILPSRKPEKYSPELTDEHTLKGTPCYPGIVEGEVICITESASDLDVRGKIICALRTDPGWIALFPACKGVIIEKGSSLSHSVILLRELGIPTVINIPGVTRKLKSGQHILLNANHGAITLIINV